MVFPKPVTERWSSHEASSHIVQNSQFFGEYNRKQHLTIEIIRIMILLRLGRERDKVPIVAGDQLAYVLR
ncbi:hypothetical protein TNCV_599901 [Trichonephila clavipes]|nr:hypothetical protein TNCV_599901 [Trichonephila clavipes]